MEFQTAELESVNTSNNVIRQFCPECGAAMVETDRLCEDGINYIWYECSESNCDGSWLRKL